MFAFHLNDVSVFRRCTMQRMTDFVETQRFRTSGGAGIVRNQISVRIFLMVVLLLPIGSDSAVIDQRLIAESRVNLLLLTISFSENGQIGEHHNGTRYPK